MRTWAPSAAGSTASAAQKFCRIAAASVRLDRGCRRSRPVRDTSNVTTASPCACATVSTAAAAVGGAGLIQITRAAPLRDRSRSRRASRPGSGNRCCRPTPRSRRRRAARGADRRRPDADFHVEPAFAKVRAQILGDRIADDAHVADAGVADRTTRRARSRQDEAHGRGEARRRSVGRLPVLRNLDAGVSHRKRASERRCGTRALTAVDIGAILFQATGLTVVDEARRPLCANALLERGESR